MRKAGIGIGGRAQGLAAQKALAGRRGQGRDVPAGVKRGVVDAAARRQKIAAKRRVWPVGFQAHLVAAAQRHKAHLLGAHQLQRHLHFQRGAAVCGHGGQGLGLQAACVGRVAGARFQRDGLAVDAQAGAADAARIAQRQHQPRCVALAHAWAVGLALQLVAGRKARHQLVAQHKGVDLVEPACAWLHVRRCVVFDLVGQRVALKADHAGLGTAFAVFAGDFARALLHQRRPVQGLRARRAVDHALHGAVAVVDAVAHHIADQHQPHHQQSHGNGQREGLLYQSVLHAFTSLSVRWREFAHAR